MDRLLHKLRKQVHIFINNIITCSQTFRQHLKDLRKLFDILQQYNIALNLTKAQFRFLSITLLGQHINALGLSTPAKQIAAIISIPFPNTLKDLEHWIGLVGWHRSHIPRFTAIMEPLEARKTRLLKSSPNAGRAWKNFVSRTKLEEVTEDETAAFETRKHFMTETFLYHQDPERWLFVDLDASNECFACTFYHIRFCACSNQRSQ